MTRVSLLLSVLFAFFTILPHYVYSYCVYNHMAQDTTLNVQQLDGQALFARGNRRFKHERIPTGESRCCAWNNNQCSKARFKGNPIILELSYNIAKDKLNHGGVYVVTCPAGGYVVATGSFGQVKYETYDADHNRLSQSAH